jgi:DtxR family transcriptional regulator, Mn-dependent transcriptional regulator
MSKKDLSSRLEDYLEAIYLIARDKQFAHANKIAEFLDVGKSSVSWALNQLSKKELVNYTPY